MAAIALLPACSWGFILPPGVCRVAVLLPAQSGIPPLYQVEVSEGRAHVSHVPQGTIQKKMDDAIEMLGLITYRVPNDATQKYGVCQYPPSFRYPVNASFLFEGDSISLACNEKLLSDVSVKKWKMDQAVVHAFDAPQQVHLGLNGACQPTPFFMTQYQAQILSEGHVVVTVTLTDASGSAPCTATFEVLCDGTTPRSSTGEGTSFKGPVIMIFIVIATRMLPRYLLEKRGQINKDSYRGQRTVLTEERRQELLRQQEAIIEQMKAQDRDRDQRMKRHQEVH